MSKKTKIWLIVAVLLVVIGGIALCGIMNVFHWDISNLSTVKYQTNTYHFSESYKNISITTDTADIIFLPSDDADTFVTCYESENMMHTVAVQDGTLKIDLNDTKKWFTFIGFSFSIPKITISMPQGEYTELAITSSTGDVQIPNNFTFASMDMRGSTGDVASQASVSGSVKIERSSGDIQIENISASTLDLCVSTGEITISNTKILDKLNLLVSTGKTSLSDVQCKELTTTGDTGDIALERVIATENLTIKRTTGDVTFEHCDAGEISVITDTGKISGSLLTDKVFITETSTGRINVPKTTSGGICEIKTDTGDIKITIE